MGEMYRSVRHWIRDQLPAGRKMSYGDLDYDWSNSVDTTRSNLNPVTQFKSALAGREYYASEPWLFDEIMRALPIRFQDFTFIDLGSGKGRVLLMASEFPFRRIVGVELLPELKCIAEQNISRYASPTLQCSRIDCLCLNACDFEFPPGPLVVYLFNPFMEPVFAMVLANLRRSLEQHPRPVYVGYRYLEFEHLLAGCGWLEKVAATEQWAIYKNR